MFRCPDKVKIIVASMTNGKSGSFKSRYISWSEGGLTACFSGRRSRPHRSPRIGVHGLVSSGELEKDCQTDATLLHAKQKFEGWFVERLLDPSWEMGGSSGPYLLDVKELEAILDVKNQDMDNEERKGFD